MRRVLWIPPLLALGGLFYWLYGGEEPAQAPDPHPAEQAEILYERAIGDLETEFVVRGEGFSEARQAISPELDALDQVIAEGREAARAAPEDEAAQQTLLGNLARKLEILHNTLMLMRELGRGDGEAARDRIENLEGRDPPATD